MKRLIPFLIALPLLLSACQSEDTPAPVESTTSSSSAPSTTSTSSSASSSSEQKTSEPSAQPVQEPEAAPVEQQAPVDEPPASPTFDPNSGDGYGPNQQLPPLCERFPSSPECGGSVNNYESPADAGKTVSHCAEDVTLYQPGTTFFTDGTTGYTDGCYQQMMDAFTSMYGPIE